MMYKARFNPEEVDFAREAGESSFAGTALRNAGDTVVDRAEWGNSAGDSD
jgi:hypothetical protein